MSQDKEQSFAINLWAEEDRITKKLKTACETMRLYMVDHVIITDGAYYSYAEEGKI